jgi:acetylornithine deacetylase/succinyl-diaminopimelate desuccinylase-like protein
MQNILNDLAARKSEHVEELKRLLRFPTVSANPAHKEDMNECAEYLKEWLEKAGLSSEILPTGGHPAVYGEWLGAPGAPTVLCYGHYDVQPPEPLELWDSPPFEPVVKDNIITARGACDDKGQFLTHLLAAESYLRVDGKLPVNLKFIIEGEEEVGSINLPETFKKYREKLAADVALVSDTGQMTKEQPSITYGLRGLVYFQIDITGPAYDLHSGEYGGAVANPLHVLSRIISELHDKCGRIAIPGFYDRVRDIEDWEEELISEIAKPEQEVANLIGVPSLYGEESYNTIERCWYRPSLDVNGMIGGYTGEGAKTVLPSKASAKISMRLVPDQRPDEITTAFKSYLKKLTPKTVKMEIKMFGQAGPVLVPIESKWIDAARKSLTETFGVKPCLMRMGGSIPIVLDIKETLGMDTLLLGWSLPGDRAHSPNERFDLDQLRLGTQAVARLFSELAARG